MTEYWVSKKSYICKYCDIFIRDDAPSRQQHESGLKHQGNKERFLRNIYKNGEKAKWAAVAEKRQMARIDKAAGIANNEPLPHIPANSSKTAERPKNVWANYSSAASLGFEVDERPLSLAELGHGVGEAGTWEEVAVAPEVVEAAIPENENTLKRRRMMAVGDAEREAEAEARDFDYSVKRKIVYDDDDDFDPKALNLALKVKERKVMDEVKDEVKEETKPEVKEEVKKEGFAKVESGQEAEASHSGFSDGLKKEGWDGKISLDGTVIGATTETSIAAKAEPDAEVKPEIKPAPAGPSMFKKRKGGPARARAREDE